MVKGLNLLSTYEAATRLGVHPKTVGRLVRQGKLVGVKVANRWVIEEIAFKKFRRDYIGRKGRPKRKTPERNGNNESAGV